MIDPTQKPRMKVVYIAGPYSAPDRAGVERNIAAATEVAKQIAKLGAMPLCPHANTSDEEFEQIHPYQFWIEGTMELLRRSDAVMLVDGWEGSRGTLGEILGALERGIPVFQSVEGVDKLVRGDVSDGRFHEGHEGVIRSLLRELDPPRTPPRDDLAIKAQITTEAMP